MEIRKMFLTALIFTASIASGGNALAKPTHRNRCASSSVLPPAVESTSSLAHRTVVVRAAWSAICCREPAARDQYRHRGGREITAGGYTLLLISAANAINTTLYKKLNSSFNQDIVPSQASCASPR